MSLVSRIILLVFLVIGGAIGARAQTFTVSSREYRAALDTAKSPTGQVYCITRLVNLYNSNRYMDSAQLWVDSVQTMLRTLKEDVVADTILLRANHAAGLYYYLIQNFSSAEQAFNIAMSLANRINDRKDKAQLWNSYGKLYREQKRYAEAMTVLDSTQSYYTHLANWGQVGLCISDKGAVLAAQDQFQEAVALGRNAIPYFERDGNVPQYMASGYLRLGNWYRLIKHQEDSAIYFNILALKMYRANNYPTGIASITYNLSILYIENKHDAKKALTYLAQASSICDSIGNSQMLPRIGVKKAICYQMLHDHPKAIEISQELLKNPQLSLIVKTDLRTISKSSRIECLYTLRWKLARQYRRIIEELNLRIPPPTPQA